MIPIEKLLEVEKKARDCGYKTTIKNGGDSFECEKRGYVLSYYDGAPLFGAKDADKVTLEQFSNHVTEINRLLELANMLKAFEQTTHKTMFDFGTGD